MPGESGRRAREDWSFGTGCKVKLVNGKGKGKLVGGLEHGFYFPIYWEQ